MSHLEGVTNIADDILIYGSTQEKHDAALEALFRRLEDNGLTLNEQKCEFNRDKIEFFGVVFSAGRISPDEKKVEAIRATKPPTNISEARSLLGMMNFCARFISDYATVCEPIRRITRKDTEWSWQKEQQTAFEKLTTIVRECYNGILRSTEEERNNRRCEPRWPRSDIRRLISMNTHRRL